jgi:hypothetical protein
MRRRILAKGVPRASRLRFAPSLADSPVLSAFYLDAETEDGGAGALHLRRRPHLHRLDVNLEHQGRDTMDDILELAVAVRPDRSRWRKDEESFAATTGSSTCNGRPASP